MATPTEKYVFTFPRDEAGQDFKWRFMVTLSKPMGQKIGDESIVQRFANAIQKIDGIDSFQPTGGRYTAEITLARTFDPDEVIAELKKALDESILSEIIRPPIII